MMKKLLLLSVFGLLWGAMNLQAQAQFDLKVLGSYNTGVFDEGAVEIVDYDPATQRAFFTNANANSVTVLDVSDPRNPQLIADISQDPYGAGVNSLACRGGIVAVAVQADAVDANGKVVFWTTDGTYLNDVEVGVLPDMLTFTPDGTKVIVANEGEPNDDYTIDPEGSISIIDISNGVANPIVQKADFSNFTDADALRASGVRIFGPNATPAQDLEPEYIAVSDDNAIAYAICQENNALAVVNIATATVEAVLPLGFKDWSLPENTMDASNRDGAINFQNWPVFGMYQPDAIHYANINGQGYIFTANEGDARDYDGFSEEERVKDLNLDPDAFPNAADLQLDENLGRLNITTTLGDTDGDGDYDEIYAYGARSFSIWNATTGALVWDSGDQLERITARYYPENFNAQNDENDFDSRSDDKGPEPEAIEIVFMDGNVYAIIGLERIGGLVTYNVTDPQKPEFVSYFNNRNFYADATTEAARDLGVEDVKFISAEDSPTGFPMVITANEVSGSLSLWAVNTSFNSKVFDEEISIDNWNPQTFVMPPSPLETQVIFVGGHDIVQTTPTYGNPAGRAIAKEWHDFIGWTPDTTGESLGWATVNHEQIYRDDRIGDGGGMTAFRLNQTRDGRLEVVEQTLEDGRKGHFFNVDFVNTVGETGMNCAGISAPDGRIWTAEEWFRGSTASIWNSASYGPGSTLPARVNNVTEAKGVRDTSDFTINAPEFPLVDGLTIPKVDNFNYMVEIDPRQAKAIRKQYNWGRAGWEGGAITQDMKTVYLGDDSSPAPWIKFEADVAGDFTQGTLYFYKHNNEQGQRWVEVPMDTEELIFGGLRDYCFQNGATMFMRNEWVAIDHTTGIVYFSETGRDGSSGAGKRFSDFVQSTNAVPAPHHEALALERGQTGATDENYQDYYGRVMFYDPATEEMGVAVQGGPYFENSPSIANYPDKHLSNPDGLKVITLDGQTFLMISEDLNGTSNGRTPEGVSNRLCELYIVSTENIPASVDELIRITAIPFGAEVTGAIQISDNTILLNSQHPFVGNPFPYNHSLTAAIHGFEDVRLEQLMNLNDENAIGKGMIFNEVTREILFEERSDYALYNDEGKRMKVYRDTKQINVGELTAGNYFFLNANDEMFELTIQ
jgi:secreted PhoX family phosphatase